MKKFSTKTKIIAAILAVGVVTSGVVASATLDNAKSSKASVKKDTVINILHTNDMHADVENLSYVAEYKDRTSNAILVDAGDAIQGQPLATYTKGEAIIDLMNKADYDLAAIGNHEFDFGSKVLRNNILKASFPYVGANVKNEDGSYFAAIKGQENKNGAYRIIKKAGKRIGFFGITTRETSYQTHPKNIEGITLEEEIATAQAMADKLNNKGCDLVVGIMHVGNDETANTTSIDIANKVEGLDLLIDGHSHTEINQKLDNGTVVVQTGTQIKTLGKVTVTFSNNDTYINAELLSEEKYQVYGKDKAVDKAYVKATKRLEPILGEVIGKTKTDLIASEKNELGEEIRIVRNRETSMGDLVADSMLWGAKEFLKSTENSKLPIVALQNGGGVRANIAAGDITINDVYTVLPFGNVLSIKVVTPDVLYKTLEFSIAGLTLGEDNKVEGIAGSYPQIAGMRFEMDLTKKAYEEGKYDGERIVAIYLKNDDGTETKLSRKDTKTEIAFASNDFLIAGGDGFTMLTNLKHIALGNVLDEILADYVTKITEEANGCFEYKMDGNRSVEINSKNKDK